MVFALLISVGALAGWVGGPAFAPRPLSRVAVTSRSVLIAMDDKRIGVGIIGAGRIGLVRTYACILPPIALLPRLRA